MGTAEKSKMSNLANQVTGISQCDYTIVDHIKTILDLANSFEKEYKEKLVATRTAHIMKTHDTLWLPDGNERPV